MEEKVEGASYAAVPKFGGWESATMPTDYSMVFATARENRKHGGKIEIQQEIQKKRNVHVSNDDHDKGHLISQQHNAHLPHKRTWIGRYFNCCIRA